MADQILAEGIRFFSKLKTQPDFVKGQIVITIKDLLAFVNANDNLTSEYNGSKQLKLQLLESKKGTLYLAVDTFKPTAKDGGNGGFTHNTYPDDLPF